MTQNVSQTSGKRSRAITMSLGALGIALVAVLGWSGLRGFVTGYYLAHMGGTTGAVLAGRQAFADHRSAQASHYYEVALSQSPEDLQIQKEAFSAFLINGDFDRAIMLAHKLTHDIDTSQDAHTVLVVTAIMKSDWLAARDLLDAFPDGPASRLFVPVMQAWIDYGQSGTVSNARYQALLDPGPLLAVTSHQAALLYELTGQGAEAEKAYQKGVQSGGMARVGFALDFGAFLERSGKDDRAKLLYDMIGQSMVDDPDIRSAIMRFKAGEKPKPLSPVIALHIANGFLTFVESLRADGHGRFSRSYVQLALYLAPSARGRLLLADLAADEEEWEVAAELYANVGGDDEHQRIAHIRQSEMLEQAGHRDRAETLLQHVFDSHPNDEVVQLALGDFYRRDENYARAAPFYQNVIQLLSAQAATENGIPWGVWFSLAMCQEQLGQWHDAERNLLRARELSGNSPIVLNYLAYSWIDRGIRLDEARVLIEEVVRKEPRNGFYVDSLGWLYFKLGEYEKALTFIERASALEPVDPVITDHLGDALWYLGRTSEARYQWRKALAFSPEQDEREKIEHKLLHGLPPLGQGGTAI